MKRFVVLDVGRRPSEKKYNRLADVTHQFDPGLPLPFQLILLIEDAVYPRETTGLCREIFTWNYSHGSSMEIT